MALNSFEQVKGGSAILRIRGTYHKQVFVYHRLGQLYVGSPSGFVRIVPQMWDDLFNTSDPKIKVLEIEGEGITINNRVLEVNL